MMAFHSPAMAPIKVLLVDNDMDFLVETSEKLQLFNYRVMSVNADATLVKSAIEDGAFLVVEKPVSNVEMKYLWQYILRERIQKRRANTFPTRGTTRSRSHASKSKVTSHKEGVEYITFDGTKTVGGRGVRPKLCTEWTPALHEKFMDAVRQLGEGRCFPKDILEIMNVPGLTRMQVASHLQKCRYGYLRNEKQGNHPEAPTFCNPGKRRRSRRPKKYGMLPPLVTDHSTPPASSSQDDNDNNVVQQGEHIPTASSDNNTEWMAAIGIGTGTDNNIALQEPSFFAIPIKSSANEVIPSESMFASMIATPELAIRMESPFNFGIVDDGGAGVVNNFDFMQLDCDYGTYAVQGSDGMGVGVPEEPGFWGSWIGN